MRNLYKWGYFFVCLLMGFGFAKFTKPTPNVPVHYHVDFKVYINNNLIDFSKAEFQSTDEHKKSQHIHLHDSVPNVAHFHMSGLTLGDLFTALGGSLSPNCVKIDRQKRCTGVSGSLRVYVNGDRVLLPHRYVPRDLDKILITYGSHFSDITHQLQSLSDDSCLYSLKCPQRGEPPTESCSSTPDSPCVLPGSDGQN